ncbi:hypothetical protein BKA63DRAFT_520342 [Paraphoma chrysanthemicola]|nr:hypothetical protein BKA63DRAFT_520342 [Paraphoma chrysanthemicola]
MTDGRRFAIEDYAYEGLWKNHNDPAFKRWTLTLSDSKALLSLACLSILIGFTQTRVWAIARYIVYQRSKSPRLDGSEGVDSRLTLSQGMAMRETLPSIKMVVVRRFRQYWRRTLSYRGEGNDTSKDDLSMSPLFGITALINVMFFLSMAVVIPWALTNGSLETPIVKSSVTEQCLKAESYEMIGDFWDDLLQADAILQQCRNRLNDTCNSRYYLREPKVASRFIDACPFLGDGVCMNNTMTLELTHEDIGAYEAGVNSPILIMMNHRIRCAPLHLGKFYLFRTNLTSNLTVDDGHTPIITSPDGRRIAILGAYITVKPKGQTSGRFGMDLRTLNGPNEMSKENSGRLLAEKGTLSDITVLPRLFADFDTRELLPELRLLNALPFLVVYRAGASEFAYPVDDPFFSAHNIKKGNNYTRYADHEATALGCAEQFQFCRRKQQDCTPWGGDSSMIYRLLNISDKSSTPNDDERSEAITLFQILPSAFSVYEYLAWHIGMLTATTGAYPLITTYLGGPHTWAMQVETWFTKAILNAILHIRLGVKSPLDSDSGQFSRKWKKKSALCGRILFQHSAYTNINWVGALCTIGSLLITCVGSYFLDSVWKTPEKVSLLTNRLVSRLGPFRFLRSSGIGVGGLVAGGNDINMYDLGAEVVDDPVNPEHEDIDAVIPGFVSSSTV